MKTIHPALPLLLCLGLLSAAPAAGAPRAGGSGTAASAQEGHGQGPGQGNRGKKIKSGPKQKAKDTLGSGRREEGKSTTPTPGKPIQDLRQARADTAARKANASPVEVALPVQGSDPESCAKALATLRNQAAARFHCETCDFSQENAGSCPKCAKPLVAGERTPLAHEAHLSADRQVLYLRLAQGQHTDLRALEALLASQGLKLRRGDFVVPAYSRILVSGGDEAGAEGLRESVASVLPGASVAFAPERSLLVVTPAKVDGALTLARLEELLARRDGKLHVETVEWCAPCKVCDEHGKLDQRCKVCCPI